MSPSNPFQSRRLETEKVARTLRRGKKMFDCHGVILTDNNRIPLHGVQFTPSAVDIRNAIDGLDDQFVVLAFEQDDLCLTAMQLLRAEGRSFLPCLQFHPTAEYWRTNSIAKDSLAIEFEYQHRLPDPKWNTPDFVNIVQALDATKNVNGVYLEVGVFKGNSARTALRFMTNAGINRRCFFWDVFIGFNYPEAKESIDRIWEGTHEVGAVDIVDHYIRGELELTGYDIAVEQKNIISDEIPEDIGEIAVANLDVDMYEAVAAGLEKIAPRIALGGILIVEDPGHTPALSGAFMALDEFLKTPIAQKFTALTMGSGQTFLIRTR